MTLTSGGMVTFNEHARVNVGAAVATSNVSVIGIEGWMMWGTNSRQRSLHYNSYTKYYN